MISIIVGILLGLILGCGFALMIVGLILAVSNKMGDSKGDFKTFAGDSLQYYTKKNL